MDGKRPSVCGGWQSGPLTPIALVGMIAPIANQCDMKRAHPVFTPHPRSKLPFPPLVSWQLGLQQNALRSCCSVSSLQLVMEVTFFPWHLVTSCPFCLEFAFLKITAWLVCFVGGHVTASTCLLGLVLRSNDSFWKACEHGSFCPSQRMWACRYTHVRPVSRGGGLQGSARLAC